MAARTHRIGSVEAPPLALGTMYFGTQVPHDQALACLDAADELGARFWDTANNYAFWAGGVGGESERVIGTWLSSRGAAARERIAVATKVGALPRTPGAGLDDPMGLTAPAVRTQVDDSLRRLQTDHVDVLYAHIDDGDVPFEETLGAFAALVDAGKVRAVAASNLTPGRLRAAVGTSAPAHYAALQQRFSYLVPSPDADFGPHVLLDDETAELCETAGLTRLGYSPLLSGAYTRADRPLPEGYRMSAAAEDALAAVADSSGLDRGQAVLAWMVQRALPVVPVVGVSRPQQVSSAWQAVQTPVDETLLDDMDRARDV